MHNTVTITRLYNKYFNQKNKKNKQINHLQLQCKSSAGQHTVLAQTTVQQAVH